MIQRKTQTDAYWREEFDVTSQDLSRIYDLILDAGRPVSEATLARGLIESTCRTDEARIQAELNRGPMYQPQDSYQVGLQVAFPALDYAWATVVGTRPARNPGYGEFTAIKVQFEGQSRVREFSSELRGEHKLNRREGQTDLQASGDVRTPAKLFEDHGSVVGERLSESLAEHAEFVAFGNEWFLRELLVPVGIGRLNIAEALIEVKGMPLPTAQLMADLDLPAEAADEIKVLSLKLAMERDGRFDNVGDGGRDVWYLRRLTPELVVNPPRRLTLRAERYNREHITEELLLVERELDEEGMGDEPSPGRPIYRTTAALTYPHWRSGTLPLTSRTQGLFPRPTADHTPIILVDGQGGDRMQGWVSQASACVFGLQEWYLRHSLPVGVFVKMERTRDPRVVTVDFEPQRLRRVWVKVATARPGLLTFQMRKLPVSCQVDEQLIVGEDNPEAIDELQAELETRGESLLRTMILIMPELVKLSPQGTVHAKAVYSAVNMLRRTLAGPIFALLASEPCFASMGGGYWSFDPARVRPGV